MDAASGVGDDRNGHGLIETVPKHGYRFVAEVHAIEAIAENGNTNPTETAPGKDQSNPLETGQYHSGLLPTPVETQNGDILSPAPIEAKTGTSAFEAIPKPTVSTATTDSGAFVLSARWSSEDDKKAYEFEASTKPTLSTWQRFRTLILAAGAASIFVAAVVLAVTLQRTNETAINAANKIAGRLAAGKPFRRPVAGILF